MVAQAVAERFKAGGPAAKPGSLLKVVGRRQRQLLAMQEASQLAESQRQEEETRRRQARVAALPPEPAADELGAHVLRVLAAAVADSELQALRGEVEKMQASHLAEMEELRSETRKEARELAEKHQGQMQSIREELEKNQAELRLITEQTAALRSDFTALHKELAHAKVKLKTTRSEAKRRKKEEEQEKLRKEEKRKKQEAKEKLHKEEKRKEEKEKKRKRITEIVTKLEGSSSSAEALMPPSKAPKLAQRLLSWLWPASSGVADGSLGNGNKDDAARKEEASPILHWLLIGGKFAATAPELRRI
ncbi:unnamed protein product [Symbiodinium sp. CCMP2456]|nr:unnamed protein product [Symbiodinium sp. CCMP2456]